MKVALVLGATGLTGKKVVRLLLADKRYDKIIALVRKPMDIIYEKLEQVPFDFDHPDASKLVGDHIYCCLGSTIKKAGSKAAFRKVDYEYVLALATLAYKNHATKFALISSMGANKNSAVFYNKIKGEVEEAIAKVGFKDYFIFRPSLLAGHRSETRLNETMAKLIMSTFSFLMPLKYRPINGETVAQVMIHIMNDEENSGQQIFQSDEIANICRTLTV